MVLSSFCSAGDVVTPITLRDELERMTRYGVSCRNFAKDKALEEKYIQSLHDRLDEGGEAAWGAGGGPLPAPQVCAYYNHMPLNDIPREVLPKLADFTVVFNVRNPYTTVLSRIMWASHARAYNERGAVPAIGVEEIRRLMHDSLAKNLKITTDNLKIIEGYKNYRYFMIRQEFLREDLTAFISRFQPGPVEVPWAKLMIRPNSVSLYDIYDWPQIQRINSACDQLFKEFGYTKMSRFQYICGQIKNALPRLSLWP